jgi:hypothetical protein
MDTLVIDRGALEHQYDFSRLVEQALYLQRASRFSTAIRSRLAIVAAELRMAALRADDARDGLLKLADSFDQHASMEQGQ